MMDTKKNINDLTRIIKGFIERLKFCFLYEKSIKSKLNDLSKLKKILPISKLTLPPKCIFPLTCFILACISLLKEMMPLIQTKYKIHLFSSTIKESLEWILLNLKSDNLSINLQYFLHNLKRDSEIYLDLSRYFTNILYMIFTEFFDSDEKLSEISLEFIWIFMKNMQKFNKLEKCSNNIFIEIMQNLIENKKLKIFSEIRKFILNHEILENYEKFSKITEICLILIQEQNSDILLKFQIAFFDEIFSICGLISPLVKFLKNTHISYTNSVISAILTYYSQIHLPVNIDLKISQFSLTNSPKRVKKLIYTVCEKPDFSHSIFFTNLLQFTFEILFENTLFYENITPILLLLIRLLKNTNEICFDLISDIKPIKNIENHIKSINLKLLLGNSENYIYQILHKIYENPYTTEEIKFYFCVLISKILQKTYTKYKTVFFYIRIFIKRQCKKY